MDPHFANDLAVLQGGSAGGIFANSIPIMGNFRGLSQPYGLSVKLI